MQIVGERRCDDEVRKHADSQDHSRDGLELRKLEEGLDTESNIEVVYEVKFEENGRRAHASTVNARASPT